MDVGRFDYLDGQKIMESIYGCFHVYNEFYGQVRVEGEQCKAQQFEERAGVK